MNAQSGLMTDEDETERFGALSQLGGVISHELNGALTAIFGGLQSLTEKTEMWTDRPPQVQRALQFIKRGAERAATLANTLQMASGQQALETERLAVGTFLSDLCDPLRAKCRADVVVQLSLDPDIWDIEIDPDQLTVALSNLVKNADEAIQTSGTITIHAGNVVSGKAVDAGTTVKTGDYVRIRVSDTGIGMSDAILKRAADMCFTTKGDGRHLGLGLCQVQRLARRLGGWMKIDSALGNGTHVELGFPRSKAKVESTMSSAVQAGHRSIVLVEDDDDARELIAEILEGLHYEVTATRNAKEALGHIGESRRIDLILTDMQLPGMGGYELAQRARALRPNTPILFMSGHSHGDFLGIDLPVENLIPKPMTKAALRERVEGLIGSASG